LLNSVLKKFTWKISVSRPNWAAEKAIKAVYISKKLVFPYIHDISQLLAALENEGVNIPDAIKQASVLTLYAAQTRYPGLEGGALHRSKKRMHFRISHKS